MEAVDLAETEQEKESISMSIISLKLYNKEITQKNLEEEFSKQTGHTATQVEDVGDGSLLVFFPCKRVYVVEKNGDVKYIGKEDEIKTVIVTADKESDLSSKQVQAVKINVKKYNADENEKITIQYAWNTSKTDEPNKYTTATLEEETTIAVIDSGEKATDNYYLWVKVKVGNTEEIKRTYGEYYIQEYTTLVSTSSENSAESGFLGNTDIQRGNIRSITFIKDINELTDEDAIYWNPSNKESDIIQAWYTTEKIDEVNYYDVTIAQDGGVIANANSRYLFAYIGNNLTETTTVTIEGLENLDTSNVTTMYGMFKNCEGLKKLDVGNFNTSRVTTMREMFYSCTGLASLNVSNFNTSNVTNMYSMFKDCEELESLDVSNFNTSSVTTMQAMFSNCKGLESLNISNFNTSNVINMYAMFNGCQGLESLDVSNFNTNNVANMIGMFSNCQRLTSLDVSNFDTSSVTTMQSMFNGCKGLESLNLSNFDTSNVTTMCMMFSNCEELTNINLSNFSTSSVTDMSWMFYNCPKLTSLNLSNFDTSNVTTMFRMFNGCEGLTILNLDNFNTSSVTNMSRMFQSCKGLKSLNLSNFDTSSVTTMISMFEGCTGLKNLDISNWVINEELDSTNIFSKIPSTCEISVNSEEMAEWVASQRK